jgi:pyruvate/2-oxoglutarate dehydrogenase complex dihydrolipoamide acyltransferase (E2) component
VEHALTAAPASAGSPKGTPTVIEPQRAERAFGRRSAEIRATVPDGDLSLDVDGDVLLDRAQSLQCSTAAVLIVALAGALRDVPRANAAYRDGRYELYPEINVAVTLPAPPVPITATIIGAQSLGAAGVDAELARLRQRATSGALTAPEQAGATITFTDLGPWGVHRGTPLLTPPQAAAVSAGAIRAVAAVREGAVVAGHELTLTIACDHRILFAPAASELLVRMAGRIGEAE